RAPGHPRQPEVRYPPGRPAVAQVPFQGLIFSFVAGLGPAIHEPPISRLLDRLKMAAGWVYFMTNQPNGVLYVGVTDNLPRRAWEHREGLIEGIHEAIRPEAPRVFRALRGYP